MAATASVADPPKNVSHDVRECRARRRLMRTRRPIHILRAELPMPKQSLLLQHPDHGADRRVRRRIRQVREDLCDRSLSELIDGIQDLAFSRARPLAWCFLGINSPQAVRHGEGKAKGARNEWHSIAMW